jgi:hypothetical protein
LAASVEMGLTVIAFFYKIGYGGFSSVKNSKLNDSWLSEIGVIPPQPPFYACLKLCFFEIGIPHG